MPRPRTNDALLTLAGVALISELIYWLVFVRPFPLARFYDTIPPVDYAKLTGHSVGGAVRYTLAIITLFIAYIIALKALRTLSEDPSARQWALGIVIAGTILFGATLALAYPTTAIDMLIYAVRTRGWALYGLNPLVTAPQNLAGDPWIGLAAEWVDAPSPYGPVWEGPSLLAFHLVGGDFLAHLFAIKVIAVLAHLGCALLVGLILRPMKPEWALVGMAAFAWNPLALLEATANAHNDILMVFFLLLAVYFIVSDRRWLVIPALTLSILTKFVTLMVLPFFLLYLIRQETTWRRRLLVAVGNLALAIGLSVILMAPVWPGWESWAVRDLGGGAGKSPFTLLVLILRPWLTTNVAFDVSRYLLGGLFLLIYAWLAWRALTGPLTLTNVVLAPTFWVFFWYLMLPNQQFHAWYLLWPLAMAATLIPSPSFSRVVVFSLTALLSITLYETMRIWWWDTLQPLVLHAIAIPFVFGIPLLVGISLPDTLQNEATFQTQLSRSEHPEPVEGRSPRLLRQAQDASARLVEKVSGSEVGIKDWKLGKGDTHMPKTVAVIGGTGNEGPGLALRWAKAGQYQVIIGSRQQEKAERVAAELNARLGEDLIRGMVNPEAAAAADLAVLTVPYSAHAPTLQSIRAGLTGKILVDVTVPLQPPKVSRVHIPPGGSATAEAQALLGDEVRVVAAFQNVGAAHLGDPDHLVDCDVLVCGDDKEAKAEVIALAEAAGMRGLDAGPLQNAVVVEGLTAVLIGINIRYKVKGAGIRITGLESGGESRE